MIFKIHVNAATVTNLVNLKILQLVLPWKSSFELINMTFTLPIGLELAVLEMLLSFLCEVCIRHSAGMVPKASANQI